MERLSQNDKKWKDIKIGSSKSSIGSNGCLLTSLCMVDSKFNPRTHITPDKAVKEWKFVKVQGDGDPKYLDWSHTDFKTMQFVWRNWGYNPEQLMTDPITETLDLEINVLKKLLKSSDYGVVFQVLTKNNTQHWLAGWDWGIFGQPVCFDPWNGKVLYKPTGMLSPYKAFTGFAIMKRK